MAFPVFSQNICDGLFICSSRKPKLLFFVRSQGYEENLHAADLRGTSLIMYYHGA